MNETLTFVLNMKEMMSGGMRNIASTAQSVFSGVDRRIANTQKQFSMAGRSISDLNNRLALLTQKRDLSIGTADIAKANREIQILETRIEKMQNRGRMQSGGGGGMRMPWWLSGAVIGGIAATGLMAMIKVGADQQRDVTGLSTFMGKDKAQSYYNQVQQDARVTPFVTHDLMAANRMLISTGMNADRARGDIMNLANAVAATGGSNYALERMAQHLQMIRGMGHASYMQLKEFTTNGINIMQLLSDATGKHIKMAHGMTVSYEAIERALAHAAEKGGLFYNALFAQSQTIWGKWSTLVDDLQLSAGKIVTGQSSAITGLLDLFDRYAQRLPAMAEQWGGAITNVTQHIIGLVGVVIDLAKWIYHNWTLVKVIIGAFVLFKAAIWAAATTTTIYNGIMTLTAIRMSAVAAAEAEATAGAVALDAAMAATPWGMIALGVAGVGLAIAALVANSKNAGKQIEDNLAPPGSKIAGVIKPQGRGLATVEDYRHGLAHYVGHVGYVWNTVDMPIPASFAKLHPKLTDPYELKQAWQKSQDSLASKMFITMPHDQGMGGVGRAAKDNARDNADAEGGDGIGSGSISGGGGKKMIFNFRNFTEHFTVNVADAAEALNITEDKFEEWWMRLLESSRRAMG